MKKTVATLTFIFLLLFASIAAAGVYMTYEEISEPKESENNAAKQSDVKVKGTKESVLFELTNAIPRLIIFCFGAIGLIVMIIKIPVNEILGYQTKGSGNGYAGFMVKEKIFSKQIIKVPLPVWWLLRTSERLEKVC